MRLAQEFATRTREEAAKRGYDESFVVQNRELTPEEVEAFAKEKTGAIFVTRAGDEGQDARALTEDEEEQAQREERFMKSAEEARTLAVHDDECPVRKGKECSCRANLLAIENVAMERRDFSWLEDGMTKMAVLVRVDDGRTVQKTVKDPVSDTARPITITVREPPRWVCLSCAAAQRGNNIDHHCDPAVLMKAQAPMALAKSLPPEVKFGGAYRLTLWRDRAGEYHLGEEVVIDGRVVEERHLVGPESYNIIEGAILDHADSKLTP